MTRHTIGGLILVLSIGTPCVSDTHRDAVKVWEEPLALPTYKTHPPDVNPMFRRPLSYQGASRVLYPYPLQDNLSNTRRPETYDAVYLENQFIKLCVLPQLGGRLFYATDKTNNYEIFYRQHAIKPSNIGMLGAWISGGIEWCVFHHHRASTFMPVDYCTSENADGSKTVWIGEFEPRHRMKWTIGITLYPGRSYIGAHLKIFNRTERHHSFLYWANVATHVDEDYQVFFPPSTQYGVFHAKGDFVHWPIAQGEYRGIDYTGVDVSWWKNHPRPISIFAHDLKEGFLAGYDHGKHAGTVHVANHHIVAGAKLWEWGPGQEGSMWDTKVLTDSDGPYAELMVGAYSDNQPDYSWIGPYEVKEARHYWYPLREIGGVKSANLDGAINLEITADRKAVLALNTTQIITDARVRLSAKGARLLDKVIDIGPATPFRCEIPIPGDAAETDLEAGLYRSSGERLITYKPVEKTLDPELPPVVEPPPPPEDIKTVEELYLAGLRIRQFHNARLNPNDYFQEALARDPGDCRCNTQLGLDAAQRGLYEEAIERFETAIQRISRNYTRPRDCEAYYQLGVVLRRQGRHDQAVRNLYRAVWDHAFRSAASFQLAEIACLQADFGEALIHINRSLATGALNTKALNLKSAILRHLGRLDQALRSASQARKIDPLDQLAGNERALSLAELGRAAEAADQQEVLERIMRDKAENYLELAVDYVNCGLWDEAIDVLHRAVQTGKPGTSDYPTIHYYLAFLHHMQGDETEAGACRQRAKRCPTDYCFPFRLETREVLQHATHADPRDARAHYYLGNLLYDRQPEMAIQSWERAVQIEPSLAIAHRNLGWGRYHAQDDLAGAIESYQLAIRHNPKDARYYYELDVLHERNATPVAERLAVLKSNHQHVTGREDALVREIIVLVQAGDYGRAIQYLGQYFFHIQEGNRRLHETHVDAHLLRGLARYHQGLHEKALEDFLMADEYPPNHQIGRPRQYERSPQIYHLTGRCCQAMGQSERARSFFEKAMEEPVKDNQYLYHQALAHRELGQEEKASELFDRLVRLGNERLGRADEADFFAKFGEGELAHQRQARAHCMMALGHLGKGHETEAEAALEKAVGLDVNHLWARYYLDRLR